MKPLEKIGIRALRSMDPEMAHSWALRALQMGLAPAPGILTSARLQTRFAGLDLPNPVGLAAGFDKNATALKGLHRAGFGFFEVGAATPRKQTGNSKPRLFRLTEDRAAINRFGFNNDGMVAIATRLAKRPKGAIIGLNLGANKDSLDRALDFSKVLNHCGKYLDFATVNVSSPNTENLRDLQGKSALTTLLQDVISTRNGLEISLPIFLKIAPDLTKAELAQIAEVALETGIDAIVTTNTTLSRDGLVSLYRSEMGGLSGKPLFSKSTKIVAQVSELTNGDLPLIGVGGICSAEDAYAKICAGASVVQLYTALVYGGLSLVENIVHGLDKLLKHDGFQNVSEAIGSKRENWL
ncbi:quinone-dependent dihydroorotate dehydrogenase [Pseudopelagicola sp. nBUS_19]|uniref:quinone-dependent dihydroorotate dehydrogenase n=1 Tax=Pseudopelagicola sp. nBUS_19 TaxID=3395316 RepID=UPI003EB82F90